MMKFLKLLRRLKISLNRAAFIFIIFFSLMLIFSILFIDPYFLQNSLADHLLEKSKDESLSFHKNWRMKVARENFKNEIVRKATSPKVLKDNAKLNSRLREIINNNNRSFL